VTAVECDRHDHDRDACENASAGLVDEPVRDSVAESAASDQAGDHDHRERE